MLLDEFRVAGGLRSDIRTAPLREPDAFAKIACPVLTLSAEDDRFGAAARARHIANSVAEGRAVIFPSGGHALVGRYADAMRESVAFMRSH